MGTVIPKRILSAGKGSRPMAYRRADLCPAQFPCFRSPRPPDRILGMSEDSKIPATSAPSEHWRKCSSCKKPIGFSRNYWVCNVSTCNRKRTGLIFCEVSCWDAHLPLMNHRESWAEERKAPTREETERLARSEDEAPRTRKPKVPSPEDSGSQAGTPSGISTKVILRRSSN